MTADIAGTARSGTSGGDHSRPRGKPVAPGPDLGAAARDAVIIYLHEASAGAAVPAVDPAEDGGSTAVAPRPPGALAGSDSPPGEAATPESEAWRAAAMSVAALDRIEAAAAKMEADIAAAVRLQRELQAGAGAAAETAVQAALEAWEAAGAAVAAEGRAAVILRRIEQYLTIAVGLILFAILVLVVTAVAGR